MRITTLIDIYLLTIITVIVVVIIKKIRKKNRDQARYNEVMKELNEIKQKLNNEQGKP